MATQDNTKPPATPLERAACAVGETLRRMGYEDAGGPTEHRHIARAVLTAIREPSEAMDQAAAECESSYVGDVYTAMIDAALAESS